MPQYDFATKQNNGKVTLFAIHSFLIQCLQICVTKHVQSGASFVKTDKLIILGTSLSESEKAIKLVNQFNNKKLFATVGCHPTNCKEFALNPEDFVMKMNELIEENINTVVAVGEIGLDLDRTQFCDIDTQKKCLQIQLDGLEHHKLPFLMHNRRTTDELIRIFDKYEIRSDKIIHSFTDTYDEAMKFIDYDCYIGINGCSMKTDEQLDSIARLPLDKILVETDCPWCEIRPSHASYKYVDTHFDEYRIKKERHESFWMVKGRCEPISIIQVIEVIANLKELPISYVVKELNENAKKIFNF
ncbi:hypothetical protein GJ496_001456 [Pomphorhynchus laevis]|nr:hypothetical protein GJ496_001456 [Pomphorhynchus laevis]